MKKMKVAVVGATGLVGRTMLTVLEERSFPVEELIPAASEKSSGQQVTFRNRNYKVITPEEALKRNPDIALFSAGADLSLQYAPKFASQGCIVIDNSSAWRMNPSVPLVVPEINGDTLTGKEKIIANPNCSTIQMVMVLAPLHKRYSIRRVIVSTYQSVSGTGKAAVDQLYSERMGKEANSVYPYQIDLNCIPECDNFLNNGYTKEEMKLVDETKKILNDHTIKISATAVRIPVTGGHSESVNVQFRSRFEIADIFHLLKKTPGVNVVDKPEKHEYPMPFYAQGKDEVFVGRIRQDLSRKKGLNLWIVSDNLRKGAATNAVQIAEYVCLEGLI